MRLVSCVGAFLLTVFAAVTAFAQTTPPGADHYLVYKVLNPPTFVTPVLLHDQFMANTYQTYTMDYFMTPVDKNNEGIIDPITHYTWWKITTFQFGATCVLTNQFGPTIPVTVGSTEYLLNPALKSIPPQPPATGPIPIKDHFTVYDASTFLVNIPVLLVDQFGPYPAVVEPLVYLAAPADKVLPGQQPEPAPDLVDHLAIYTIIPQGPAPPPPPPPVFATDEFGVWQLVLGDRVMLCVPSFKNQVTDTKSSTWGRLKQLYR